MGCGENNQHVYIKPKYQHDGDKFISKFCRSTYIVRTCTDFDRVAISAMFERNGQIFSMCEINVCAYIYVCVVKQILWKNLFFSLT